jgi:hypothetical protein
MKNKLPPTNSRPAAKEKSSSANGKTQSTSNNEKNGDTNRSTARPKSASQGLSKLDPNKPLIAQVRSVPHPSAPVRWGG